MLASSFVVWRKRNLAFWAPIRDQRSPESTGQFIEVVPFHDLEPLIGYVAFDSHILDRQDPVEHETLDKETFIQILDLAWVDIVGQVLAEFQHRFRLSRRIVDFPAQTWRAHQRIWPDTEVLAVLASLESEASASAYPGGQLKLFT